MTVDSTYRNHLLPPQQWELQIADQAGLTLSMLRFAIAFFASVPVAIVMRRIPSVRARHIYSFVTGFLLIYYPFGNGTLHALITSAITYLLMRRFRPHCGTLTWIAIFPYLIANHVAQASGTAWREGRLDFTGAQMVLTLKLVAIAVCYQDGARSDDSGLREYAKSKRLDALPSPLEFLSYLFAMGNLLSGPFFEAKDYFDFVERRGDWAPDAPAPPPPLAEGEEEGKDARRRRRRAAAHHDGLPSPLLPGAYRLAKALLCAAVWMHFTRRGLTESLLESDAWQVATPFPARIFYLWATVVVFRFKYYFVWGVAESALIFSGMGFKRYTAEGRPLWTRYINSHIRGVELNPSLAEMPRHWNICTGLWLRHYVYERLTPPHRKPSFLNMVATQLVSGVWHGVFAGYWLFFATSAFMFQASRLVYRYEQGWPPALQRSPLWAAIKVVASALVLDYAGAAFIVLSLEQSWAVWRSVHFFGHALVGAVLLVGVVMPPRRRVSPAAAATAAAGGKGEAGMAVVEAAGAAGGAAANGAVAVDGKKDD